MSHQKRVGIAALIWASSILLSRVIGLVREAVIGRTIGGDGTADVFWASFILPDFLNYLLAGGALSIVFIPIFGTHLAEKNEEKGWESFWAISSVLVLALGIIVPVLWLCMPWIVPLLTPGFSAEQFDHLIYLTRIILPAQIFHLLGGLLSAALQARDKHAIPAIAPLVYTIGIIVGGVIGQNAAGFAWGALIGSILGPFALPLLANIKFGMQWRPTNGFIHPDAKTYLWRSLPIMLGFSIIMFDDWILKREGSFLNDGAISSLQYAKTLMRVPMGVFGLAVGAAVYPTLSRLIAEKKDPEAYQLLSDAVKRALILALGAQVVLSVCGTEIAKVIYGNRLLEGQHEQIGTALAWISIGLWAWAAQTIVARGFYARGNTWTPTLLGSGITALAIPVYIYLRQQNGIYGLAQASSIAISTYVIVLMWWLQKIYQPSKPNHLLFFIRVVPATAVSIAIGLFVRPHVDIQYPFIKGALIGSLSGFIYIILILVFQVQEAKEVLRKIQRKMNRKR